jgi:hypothetical protein
MAILNRTPALEDEIKNVRARIEAFVAARVAELRKTYTDLPDSVVRADLLGGNGCLCLAFLDIKQRDDEAKSTT